MDRPFSKDPDFYKGENFLWACERSTKDDSNLNDYIKDLHAYAYNLEAQNAELQAKLEKYEGVVEAASFLKGITVFKGDFRELGTIQMKLLECLQQTKEALEALTDKETGR